MDRCEACPLFDTASETGDSCGGGLPVSVCITNCNAPYSSWRKNENYGLKEELPMNWNHQKVAQLKLPDPADEDPHPRLMLGGNGIHAESSYTALFPNG